MVIHALRHQLVFWLACILLVQACSIQSSPDISQAKSYSIVRTWVDGQVITRRQLHIAVTSEASTMIELAHTAMSAALTRADQVQIPVVVAHLVPNPSLANKGWDLAIATYAKDGRGYTGKEDWVWQVAAVNHYPAKNELEIINLWDSNLDRFYTEANALNERKLREFIAKRLKRPLEAVRLPWWKLQEYMVE